MNPEQFAQHLESLKSILPASVLVYAKDLGTDDAHRAQIAMYLANQAEVYKSAAADQAKTEAAAAEIKKKMGELKKA